MEVSLCERFPALTPFGVRKIRIIEVLKIWGRLLDKIERDRQNRDPVTGEEIIWKPAGDDWF